MINKIRKRDGRVVPFDKEKIIEAVWKAAKVAGGEDRKEAEKLGDLIIKNITERFRTIIPEVENIQDLVEKILVKERHYKTAKAYMLYRKSHQDLREIKAIFDTIEAVEDYVGEKDWEIKENSNMGFSLQGLNNYISEKIIKNYWLRRIYPEEIRKVHESGELHIHDLGTLGPYCVGWDLRDLIIQGFKGVPGKVQAKPAKHLRTILGQIVNFFYTLQGEAAGAQAFSNFDTLLAPFIRYDNLDYKEVKQCLQEFCFNMAVPTRVGFQTPFTNITLDIDVPEYMKNESVIVSGKPQKETYSEFQKEIKMIGKAFAEVMMEGDSKGRPFSFPIPTYNITKDFDWENPEYDAIWEMTAKYGIPYFSNFINSDMKPEDARSMCCRLRLDKRELKKRGGGLFGSNPLTGSIGVVTINMARLGFTSANEEEFFFKLNELMELAKESLEIKRKALENFTEKGLYPYSKFYLRNIYEAYKFYWKNHFSTIGLLGMNEAIINFIEGEDISTDKGHNFAKKVLDFMRNKLEQYQEETGNIYNLEATPGEGTTYRFAKTDKKRFGKIKTANEEGIKNGGKPYYTNSTNLPVNYTQDLFHALELQDPLQIKYTGGTVFHAFIGEKLDKDAVKILVKKVAENFKLPYFTITPTFSICPNHGYITGKYEYCPTCEKVSSKKTRCEVYSRVVGYLRPIKQWNEGKVEEFKDRILFEVGEKVENENSRITKININ